MKVEKPEKTDREGTEEKERSWATVLTRSTSCWEGVSSKSESDLWTLVAVGTSLFVSASLVRYVLFDLARFVVPECFLAEELP